MGPSIHYKLSYYHPSYACGEQRGKSSMHPFEVTCPLCKLAMKNFKGLSMNKSVKTENSLKELARLLREAEDEPKKEEGEDSVDAQIDKYLSQYESQAKEESQQKFESVSYDKMTRDWRSLTEAEDEKKDEESELEKTKIEEINMGSFVADVMRLVENYESLLEIKNTVLRRAANYLSQNYEGDALQAFKDELLESYGVEIGQSESEKDDEIQAPKAGAAGPMAGGGGAA